MYGPSFDSSGTGGTARVIQENDYYPFGLTVKYLDYSNGNRYLYNRKEQQLDLTNQYDYGARFYDPVIGRWTTVDPDAENYESTSSYAYVLNNPINLGDLDGRDTIHLKEVFIKEPVPVPAPAPTPVYEPLTILEQIGTVGGAVLRGGLLTFALVSIPLNGEDIHEDAEMKKYWRHVHASKKSVKEVLKDAKHLDKTANGHDEYNKDGGYKQAEEDFDDVVDPTTVKPMRDGSGRYGNLPDGTPVNVRDKSTSQRGSSPNGDPTLEIQNKGGGWDKIRYP